MAEIKKIHIGEVDYDLVAKYILDTAEVDPSKELKTWQDIVNLVSTSFELVVLQTLPEASESAYNTYKKDIVLVPDATSVSGSYVEYVILDKGSEANPRYVWEKIGTTSVDLQNYVQKGTYTTAAAGSTTGDNSNAGATFTTGEGGAQTATGTATVTYEKVSSIDDHIIEAHSHTVNITTGTATFVSGVAENGTVEVLTAMGEGSTEDVISTFTKEEAITVATEGIKSVSLTASTTAETGAITYTEDITGSAPSLTGTTEFVTGLATFSGGSKAADTFVANVPTAIDTTKFDGGTFTQGAKASFTQGAKASCTHTSANVMQSATVDANGVLSWSTVSVVDAMTFTANGDDTFVANGDDLFTAATLNSGFYSAGSAAQFTEGAFTGATLGLTTATFGITGGSYSATKKYVKPTTVAAATDSVVPDFTAGTTTVLSGLGETTKATVIKSTGLTTSSATFVAGVTLNTAGAAILTHTLNTATASATGSASVAVSDHTHVVTVPTHTHSVNNHTHDITLNTPTSNN